MPKVTVFSNPKGKREWRDVYGRLIRMGDVFRLTGRTTEFRVVAKTLAAGFIPTVTGHTLDGKHQTTARAEDVAVLRSGRAKNPRGPRRVARKTTRRTTRRNPPTLPVSFVLSDRAIALAYKHAEDGHAYEHKFATGVRIQLLGDGSVRLYRPDGRPTWKNFR